MHTAQNLSVFSFNISVSNQVSQNLDHVLWLLSNLPENAARSIVLLPEMLAYMGPYSHLPDVAKFAQETLLPRLAVFAKERQLTLFAGSVPELPSNKEVKQGCSEDKVFNTAFVIDPTGNIIRKYRKIHLFNLRGVEPSQRYCESDGFHPGKDICTFKHAGWNVALAICYDLRFPELFLKFHEKQTPDVIFLPAAFTHYTGSYHWELLLRARAVENQCYVVASNQTGTTSEGKAYWGHSLIIDPWGRVLQDAGEKEGFIQAMLEKAVLEKVRSELPALQNRIRFSS